MSSVILRSLGEGIADEARYLHRFDRARSALLSVVEARDEDAIRIIRAITENQGVSKGLRKLYPELLSHEATAQRIEHAVLNAFIVEEEGDASASLFVPRG